MTHEPCAVVVALFFLSCVYEFCMILASNFTVGCALFTSPPRQDPTLVRENGPPRNRDPPRRSRQSWSRHWREKCDHRCLIGWLESPPPARGGLLVSCYLLPVYMYAVHRLVKSDQVATLEQTLRFRRSGSYEFLRSTDPEIGSLRFLARGTKRQPEVLNTGGS